ncbi:MAG: hypothetical protein H7A33_07470 [Deltaproteobacteria bacterium]|nr:hypothetical protein [Deltaproteobacteria bacterium]
MRIRFKKTVICVLFLCTVLPLGSVFAQKPSLKIAVVERSRLLNSNEARGTLLKLAASYKKQILRRTNSSLRIDLKKIPFSGDQERLKEQLEQFVADGGHFVFLPDDPEAQSEILAKQAKLPVSFLSFSGSKPKKLPKKRYWRFVPDTTAGLQGLAERLNAKGIQNVILVAEDSEAGEQRLSSFTKLWSARKGKVQLVVKHDQKLGRVSKITADLIRGVSESLQEAEKTAIVLMIPEFYDEILADAEHFAILKKVSWYAEESVFKDNVLDRGFSQAMAAAVKLTAIRLQERASSKTYRGIQYRLKQGVRSKTSFADWAAVDALFLLTDQAIKDPRFWEQKNWQSDFIESAASKNLFTGRFDFDRNQLRSGGSFEIKQVTERNGRVYWKVIK